jgi:hypothetical protein
MGEKIPEGCHRLANFLENIRSKYKEATDLYKKTCDEMKASDIFTAKKCLKKIKTFFFQMNYFSIREAVLFTPRIKCSEEAALPICWNHANTTLFRVT